MVFTENFTSKQKKNNFGHQIYDFQYGLTDTLTHNKSSFIMNTNPQIRKKNSKNVCQFRWISLRFNRNFQREELFIFWYFYFSFFLNGSRSAFRILSSCMKTYMNSLFRMHLQTVFDDTYATISIFIISAALTPPYTSTWADWPPKLRRLRTFVLVQFLNGTNPICACVLRGLRVSKFFKYRMVCESVRLVKIYLSWG